MTFDKEFKFAISNLPSKEKDKLILRLLRKDLPLSDRLYFELVSTDSVEDRRDNLEKQILKKTKDITLCYYNPWILVRGIQRLSVDIREHVFITKDKYGDVSLHLILLNEILNMNHSNIDRISYNEVYKLGIYIVAKIFKILILANALHEDFRVEFNDLLISLGEEISKSDNLMHIATRNGLDINWLLTADIPDDIKEIHRKIRAQGLLR